MSESFHEVRFPLRLSLVSSGGPVRRTDIVNLSNGREARNRRWANSRRAYDAGSGVRSLSDLYAVLDFFEARGGSHVGFRFKDPVDGSSARPGVAVTALDQRIGTGDGATVTFQLVKTYGDAAGSWTRTITKPVDGSVIVSVAGTVLPAHGFSCDPETGLVTLDEEFIPLSGQAVRAGFEFDVPVRFDTDRLDLNVEAFNAGRIPTIPLLEILP